VDVVVIGPDVEMPMLLRYRCAGSRYG